MKLILLTTRRAFFNKIFSTSSERVIVERKQMGHPAKFLFAIVADVKKYREFLPLCTYSEVLTSTQTSSESMRKTVEKATLGIGFSSLPSQILYTSIVTKEEPSGSENKCYRVLADALQDENIEYIQTEWIFSPRSAHSSQVELKLRFKFKSLLLNNIIAGPVLKDTSKLMLRAFEARAEQISKSL